MMPPFAILSLDAIFRRADRSARCSIPARLLLHGSRGRR